MKAIRPDRRMPLIRSLNISGCPSSPDSTMTTVRETLFKNGARTNTSSYSIRRFGLDPYLPENEA